MKINIAFSVAAIAVIILFGLYFGTKTGSDPLPAASLQEGETSAGLARTAIPIPPAGDAAPSLLPAQPERPAETLLQRIAAGDTNAFKLSNEQIEDFLVRNRTNAESL